MQKSRTLNPAAGRRRAALWSVPLLAAALGLAAPWAEAQTTTNRAQEAPERPGVGTTGTGIGPAGSTDARDASRTHVPASATTHDARASELIGMNVQSPQGESLGEIRDLIVDVNNQRVHYAVLSFGGFLGMGNKQFAYPVRMFGQTADGEQLVLNVNREQLRDWPGFEEGRQPNWNDERYRSEVDRFHGGGAVAVQPRENMRLVRASELLDRDINDLGGNDAGEVEDLVVNLREGEVRYVVMSFDRGWLQNDRLVALPMNAFDVPTREDVDLRLNVDRNQLRTARGFTDNDWARINDPNWRRNNEQWLSGVRTTTGTRDAAGSR